MKYLYCDAIVKKFEVELLVSKEKHQEPSEKQTVFSSEIDLDRNHF